uniref:Uncharacterized protein n=1 Tax=Polytomella parva TaxID=51329 RepID=A0A7S0YD33_9CHLO|mmetsp:Transcript_1887/g.2790  ORF Transcript_1887/g.2790 Transcript_1887/m.2790 type:complete len:202 (+) Transcript_1887:86-691(+)
MSKPTDITATLRCKIAILGDCMVGKTALISMFKSKKQKFPKEYQLTHDVDISTVEVLIPDTTISVQMYIYDTSGNDLYKDQLAAYWNGIYYAILVYDVSNFASFDSCKQWFETLKQARVNKDRAIKVVLCGTKTDLPKQRHAVTAETAEKFAESIGAEHIRVSSLPPGEDVENPFMVIAKTLHKNYEDSVASFKTACGNYT